MTYLRRAGILTRYCKKEKKQVPFENQCGTGKEGNRVYIQRFEKLYSIQGTKFPLTHSFGWSK